MNKLIFITNILAKQTIEGLKGYKCRNSRRVRHEINTSGADDTQMSRKGNVNTFNKCIFQYVRNYRVCADAYSIM